MAEEKQLTPEEEYDFAFDESEEELPGKKGQKENEEDLEKEVIQQQEGIDDESGDDAHEQDGDEGTGDETDSKDATSEESDDDKRSGSEPTLEEQLEAARAESAAWEHKYRSDEGRFRAAQQKMQELSKKQPQPSKEQFLEALKSEKAYKEFCEDYPDIAEVLTLQAGYLRKAIIGELQPTLEGLQNEATLRRQDAEVISRQRAIDSLTERIPNWREITASEGFKSWAQKQPPYKQQIILNSQDANESASVLEDYLLYQKVADMERKNDEQKNNQEKNKQRLERSRTVPPKSTGVPSALPKNDFDAVFDSITQEE